MLVANIKIWKSHLNIREGSDYVTHKLLTQDKDMPSLLVNTQPIFHQDQ